MNSIRNISSSEKDSTPAIDMTSFAWEGRAILLVDLDAFFASVEQLDHPQWRGKPVIVGGDADKRGVVSTCSYEARAYGVRSAMPSWQAHELCPDAIWTRGHFDRYREISAQVMTLLHYYTPLVQQVSIDEAFMDVTTTRADQMHPVRIAQEIARRIDALGISASIGLGSTKAIAKIASDQDKPRGLTVVFPGREQQFLYPLPIKVMSGIGAKSQERLHSFGIHTLRDLARADEDILREVFGSNAQKMRLRAQGIDTEEVKERTSQISISNELTFSENIMTDTQIREALLTLSAKVARRLRDKHVFATEIGVKLRYISRQLKTIQTQLSIPIQSEQDIYSQSYELLYKLWDSESELRLIGIQTAKLLNEDEARGLTLPEQTLLSALTEATDATCTPDESSTMSEDKKARLRKLSEATDLLRAKYGDKAVSLGSEILTYKNTSGSSSKHNPR